MIKNVILDFGHGGIDESGRYTTAPAKMYTHPNGEVAYEGVLNREFGSFLLQCLGQHPELNVVTTVSPYDSYDMPLHERVAIANQYNPKETIFVSIHCNAGKGRGFEIWTSRGQTKSDILAQDIYYNVRHVYSKQGIPMRHDMSDGDVDKESDFYVLRKTKCPSVLLEMGFFDRMEDLEYLKDPLFQGNVMSFVYTGILDFIDRYERVLW
jgi:N-acetylmuramoyl-L-alanine amidase